MLLAIQSNSHMLIDYFQVNTPEMFTNQEYLGAMVTAMHTAKPAQLGLGGLGGGHSVPDQTRWSRSSHTSRDCHRSSILHNNSHCLQ